MNQYVKGFISFVLSMVILANNFYYCIPVIEAEETKEVEVHEETKENVEEIELLDIDIPENNIHPEETEVVFVDGSKVIQKVEREPVVEEEIIEEPQPTPNPAPPATNNTYTNCLTRSGGVYWNPYTGLKETWYSQRVLPGGGLNIPGRHVNEEGFVCDVDGYICVASSDYPKGTVIETSRGIGKVYDCGCASGTVDLYTDW